MDEDDLYDEFGNLIGAVHDSDSDSGNDEVILPNFQQQPDSDDEDEDSERMEVDQAIVLHEDKQYYPSISETFGPDVETIIATEDAQDIDEPIIKPLERQTFQLEEAELPETTYSKQYMSELSKIPERVRNIVIAGDLHSGKTTFLDMLILHTHPTLHTAKQLRYTDNHKLERAKGISLKTVPISLLLPNLNSKSVMVNVLDTPGHVNFLDEVSVGQTTADSTVICIDSVQGLSRMDELVIENCLQKNIPMCFVLNKIDRLIMELRLPAADAYFKLRSVLDEINSYISENKPDSYTYESVISPELGNVLFASSYFQFCFSLKSFIMTMYGDQVDVEAFALRLWGDIYFQNGAFTMKPDSKIGSSNDRSFVKFILEPLYKIFNNCLVKEGKDLRTFLEKNFGLKLSAEYYKLDSQSLLRYILQQIFESAAGFVDIIENLPSPIEAYEKKRRELGTDNNEVLEHLQKCDHQGPLIAHVTKLVDTIDSKKFYGLVKVVSGTLQLSSRVKILGENYVDDDEDVIENEKVTKLYISGARYRVPVEALYAGSVGYTMTDNLDSFITKTGTIYEATSSLSTVFKPLDYLTRAVFKVAVEPKNPSELHKLLEGFRKINRSYVGSEVRVEESGEHVVLGSGELYMDCLLHDLRKLYTDIEIKVSDPLTKFAETCLDASMKKIGVKSANGLNEVSIVVEPLEADVIRDIEDEVITLGTSTRKLSKWFRDQYKWDSLAARSIWSFGPSSRYPNVLLDDTLPDEVEKARLLQLKSFIIQGFHWAMREGPMSNEPVRGLKFKVMHIKLAPDLLDSNGGQIIPMVRNACYAAMLLSSPQLLEPTYQLDIVVKLPSEQDHQRLLKGLSDLLHRRRGNVFASAPVPASPLYKIQGSVPVLDSVGLETDIRLATQGQAMCFLTFSNWSGVPGDPMDAEAPLPNLKPVPYSSLARDCVMKTRRRKGLNGEPGLGKYIDADLLQDLKDSGII